MKTRVVALLILGGLPLACFGTPKDGGEVLDSGNDDEVGSSDGEGSGTGNDSVGESSGTPATSGSTSQGESGEATTGGVPQACEAAGWSDSLSTYESMAAAMDNTYWYTQISGGPGGFEQEPCTYETRVEVVDGALLRRTFSIIATEGGLDPAECGEAPFVEEVGTINDTTDAPHAFVARTMEDNYAGCCDLLALEPAEEYMTGFVVDDTGIMSACYSTFANCADGCTADVDGFSSLSLASFTWGVPPQ